ncbi:MAG TPA: hypothetical protein VJA19_10030 [Pseudomonas sp.]|nr:hypothetical protein [Pseudomonas sp.]
MKHLCAVLLAFMIAGCMNPPYQPQNIEVSGAYTQADTGIIFPPTSGIFRRVEMLRIDERASHIYVGYNSELIALPIIVSVYVYPGPQIISIGSPPEVIATARQKLLLDQQAEQKQGIVNAHPGGRLIAENAVTLLYSGQSVPGLRVDYEFHELFQGEVQKVNSALYLFDLGDSMLKFRISSPASVDSEAPVAKLMAELASTAP